MRKPAFLQPRILKQAIISALSPAYTTAFPAEPFEPQDAFRGRPRYNADGCVGCGACAQVCPPKCIELIDDVRQRQRPPGHNHRDDRGARFPYAPHQFRLVARQADIGARMRLPGPDGLFPQEQYGSVGFLRGRDRMVVYGAEDLGAES